MKKYYVANNEQQEGPFSIEDLNDMKITPSTLLWTENTDSWQEAKNFDELKDIIKKIPPPIPSKETRIEKAKSDKRNVTVAKETKSIFSYLLYSLVIGLISFPVYYFIIYNATKFDNFDVNQVTQSEFMVSGIPADLHVYNMGNDIFETHNIIRETIKSRKQFYFEKSLYNSLFTFLIATAILVTIKYITRTTKWVRETSKKEL